MTDVERRFETAMREADTDEPGLVLEDDGTVWKVAPGGARTELGVANGGSQTGAAVVRGPYSFDVTISDMAALGNGVAVYTPTIDDVLIDAWFEITTVFNSQAQADISQFSTISNNGLFGYLDFPVPLNATADTVTTGGGPLQTNVAKTQSLALRGVDVDGRLAPGRFVSADPLILVVSQNGSRHGTTVAATVGAARLYIVTATPAAFS